MLVFSDASTSSASGYGLFLLETVAALALIAVAAWALVRFSGRRELLGRRGTRLRPLERLSLDARRSVHLVQVDDETLLLGVSEHGVTLLKALTPQASDVAAAKESAKEQGEGGP